MKSLPAPRLPARIAAALALSLLPAAPAFALEALSIDPAWVPKNTPAAGAVSTIRGLGFTPSTTVAFDGAAAAVTFVDSRTLTVQAPTSTAGKIARVVVANPGGATDDLFPFIYTDKSIYVSSAGNDGNSGTSPLTPKRTIVGALAVTAGVTNLILVTEGRFGDNQLGIPSGYVVAGGWDLAFTTRNPDLHVSVIDSNQLSFNLRSFGLDAKVVVDGLTFMDGLRDGTSGGSIEFVGDQVAFSNNVIVGNSTSAMGAGMYINFSTSYGGRTSVSNNVIVGNRSYGGPGAGIAIYPFYTLGNSLEVAITDNYIAGNRSYLSRGGGVAFTTNAFYGYNVMNLKLVGNTIVGNSAKAAAGVDLNFASHTDAINLLADNNVIALNRTAGEGGGLTVSGLGLLGGSLTGATIASNTAGTGVGAGLAISPGVSVDPGFTAKDLIVWGNVADDSTGPMSLVYSDVGSGGVPGAGNISVDPRFVRGLRGRFYLAQNDPNAPVSPAVDAGSDAAAATGNDALTTSPDGSPDAGTVDMGAHYQLAPPGSPDPIDLMRLDPNTGDTFGTDWVLLRGRGFDPGARVNFGAAEAATTIYISPNRILAQPALHSTGTVNATVTNPDSTSDTITGAYRYLDNYPPVWSTTVGAQAAQSPLDCVRSIIVDWNEAQDVLTPPVRYEIHKFSCEPAPEGAPLPCNNWFDFIPTVSNRIAVTKEPSYIDTAFTASGSDPKFMYIVRAIDSANPINRELNHAKRVGLASKNLADTTPPARVGDTVDVSDGNLVTWGFSRGAVAYRVYRETVVSRYGDPSTLTPFVTLNAANNDLDGDGLVDTRYTDAALPFPGQSFFYKVTALDPCNVESRSDLQP